MTAPTHITAAAAALLDESRERRIDFCLRDYWVQYSRANYVLQRMEAVLKQPPCLRPRNLLIPARSGNGKTSIVQHFTKLHTVDLESLEKGQHPIVPVLRIEMPESPDESEFWSLILDSLRISCRERTSAVEKKNEAKSLLRYTQTRVLIIDEFNNLANSGKMTIHLLGAIKGLGNDLQMSIIAAGTQAAINALHADPQMTSRFDACPLPRWTLNAEYLRFLASYERLLPLAEPSNLASRELAPKIYAMGGETLGNTVRVLKASAAKAIEMKKECITEDALEAIEWIKPSDWDAVARSL